MISKKRIEQCETNGSSNGYNPENKQLQNMFQQLDPANRRAAFIGITGSEAERLQAISVFISNQCPGQNVTVGHFFKGARGSRSSSSVSFAEFPTEDARDSFIRSVGNGSVRVGNKDVIVKKALSKINAARNTALRRAGDLIKAHANGKDKTIKIEWVKERGVTVDGTFAFTQNKTELQGTFTSAFADLKLD